MLHHLPLRLPGAAAHNRATASTWLFSRGVWDAAAARADSAAARAGANRSSRNMQTAEPACASARPGSSRVASWNASPAPGPSRAAAAPSS